MKIYSLTFQRTVMAKSRQKETSDQTQNYKQHRFWIQKGFRLCHNCEYSSKMSWDNLSTMKERERYTARGLCGNRTESHHSCIGTYQRIGDQYPFHPPPLLQRQRTLLFELKPLHNAPTLHILRAVPTLMLNY